VDPLTVTLVGLGSGLGEPVAAGRLYAAIANGRLAGHAHLVEGKLRENLGSRPTLKVCEKLRQVGQ